MVFVPGIPVRVLNALVESLHLSLAMFRFILMLLLGLPFPG